MSYEKLQNLIRELNFVYDKDNVCYRQIAEIYQSYYRIDFDSLDIIKLYQVNYQFGGRTHYSGYIPKLLFIGDSKIIINSINIIFSRELRKIRIEKLLKV